MTRLGLFLAAALIATLPAIATLPESAMAESAMADPAAAPAAQDCVRLASEAEAQHAIPPGILQSVALVESGIDGVAWPWTVNAGGQAYYLADRATAIALAHRAVLRYGAAVAVGCMQISLRWHGGDFATLDQMLNARTNVGYAARLLVAMRVSYGSWVEAVKHYNASQPVAQADYLCRVVRVRQRLGYQQSSAAGCGR